ncbi:MAG: DUF3135 domain-containing protein [Thioalkalispiraceae bacterium]|jgi:hypothetical protein
MKQSTDAVKWDFSYWMELAMNDPEEFESKRAETINRAIQNASEESRVRLERLQWRIDRARERSSSPMAATLEISRMMWDSFYTLRDRYQELFSNTPMPRQAAQPRHEAQVIQFARYAEARG